MYDPTLGHVIDCSTTSLVLLIYHFWMSNDWISLDNAFTSSSFSNCVLNEIFVISFSTTTAILLSLYHLLFIYSVTSLVSVVSSKAPATPIFTHPVNSSEYLALAKNRNKATTNASVQNATRTYECFMIENGAFILKIHNSVKNVKNSMYLPAFFKGKTSPSPLERDYLSNDS